MRKRHDIRLPLSALALVLSSTPVWAQDVSASADDANASRSGLSDIIVTATRRETNVQDTPIAISAISGDSLRQRGITDPRQLSGLAPNLNIDQGQGIGQTHVSIRGQTSTSFSLEAASPAATYLDDVYQPYQFGIGTQIFDINRIEVLRGPQGTLFGKNTTAGSVNYYSQTPVQKDEGYLTLDGGGGDFGRYAVEGAFNKVLSPDLAARFSFRVEHRDDYVRNAFNDTNLGQYNNYNARLQFAWTPGDDTTVNLKLFGLKHKGDAPIYIARGYFENPCNGATDPYFLCDAEGTPVALPANSRQATSEVPSNYENFDNYGATLKIDHSFGDWALTSISNIQEGHYAVATNDDGMAGDFFHSKQQSKAWQMSQELRLATPASAPLRAVLGVYAQYDRITSDQGSISSLIVTDPSQIVPGDFFDPVLYEYTQRNLGDTATTTFAGFGSVTYEFSPAFSIIGGLRYSIERKEAIDYATLYNNNLNLTTFDAIWRDITEQYFDFDYALSQFNPSTDELQTFNGKKTFKKLTWDVTVNFKPSEDSLLYAKVGTGFRSGGFFPAPDGAVDANGDPTFYVALSPETVTSYEAGFKSEWLDRKLRLNGAIYYVDYKNLQIQTANVGGAGLGFSNASSAEIKGVELELEAAPIDRLLISASMGYNDATYKNYVTLVGGELADLSGNPLPYAPKWTGNLAVSYSVPVGDTHNLNLSTDWSYRSRYYFDSFASSVTEEPERFIGGARIGFGAADGGWELAAYVNNLLNEDVRAFSFTISSIAPTIYAPRRTWGLQANFRF